MDVFVDFSIIYRLFLFFKQTEEPTTINRAEYTQSGCKTTITEPGPITPRRTQKNPKADRPDLAMEQNFRQIVDPQLKTVPSERLVTAFNRMQSLKNSGMYYRAVLGQNVAHPT
ncbi:MAG: hypothetical protein R3C26_09515 [Calditrichia bacterium]